MSLNRRIAAYGFKVCGHPEPHVIEPD